MPRLYYNNASKEISLVKITYPCCFNRLSFDVWRLQWDWSEAQVHMKDVLNWTTTAHGEQCVMTISLTQQLQLFAVLWVSCTFYIQCVYAKRKAT